MNITAARPTYTKLSLEGWDELIKPSPGEGQAVLPGRRANEPVPASMAEVRQQVDGLDFHPINPFVASVGGSVSASQMEIPKGETSVGIRVPDYYAEEVEVLLGVHNGPNAPMLVILPGIHSAGVTSHSLELKKLALERGMNYVVLPNSMSEEMLEDMPYDHPGNTRVDALWSHQILGALKERYPEYFARISVAGYSYGGLQGANLVRLDEESPDRLINGSLVALSPPENLAHSMRQLDGLRNYYAGESGTISDTGVWYKHDVKKFGYVGFMESGLAKHGPGSNLDEIEIADKYGSRDSLKQLIEIVDTQFGHNQLPMNTQQYQQANLLDKMRMRKDHKHIVENITYDQLSSDWMSKDGWLAQHGMTPTQLADRYSFSHAMQAIESTPVLVLATADDYILSQPDVQSMRNLQAHPGALEVTRVFDSGGHVGLDWNPKIAETMIDFAMAGDQLHEGKTPAASFTSWGHRPPSVVSG